MPRVRLSTQGVLVDPNPSCFVLTGLTPLIDVARFNDKSGLQRSPKLSSISSSGARATAGPRAPATKRLEPLRFVDAGVLNVAYYEDGPIDGTVVVLMHGFPYDIHSYVDVAPMLVGHGCRVIVPYMRGYGSTRFLDASTPRSGEQAAFGAERG
jgi:hypothetical protein